MNPLTYVAFELECSVRMRLKEVTPCFNSMFSVSLVLIALPYLSPTFHTNQT